MSKSELLLKTSFKAAKKGNFKTKENHQFKLFFTSLKFKEKLNDVNGQSVYVKNTRDDLKHSNYCWGNQKATSYTENRARKHMTRVCFEKSRNFFY